jgi:hypothetical protein
VEYRAITMHGRDPFTGLKLQKESAWSEEVLCEIGPDGCVGVDDICQQLTASVAEKRRLQGKPHKSYTFECTTGDGEVLSGRVRPPLGHTKWWAKLKLIVRQPHMSSTFDVGR